MANMASVNVTITIPDVLHGQVEESRGDVSRSVWIKRAIEQRLDRETNEDLGFGRPTAPAGPVTSADAQGAIEPDVLGLNRPLRHRRHG